MVEEKEVKVEMKNEIVDNKRNIGLDVLRILSMVMILFLHYIGKGGLLGRANNDQIQYYLYYWIEAISIVAVNCYVLISGYFLVHSKFKWKKVFQLWGETIFYSVIIYFIIVVLDLKEFAIKDAIKSLFPILTKQYWFVNVYLMLYMLSPFLNKLIFALTKKEYKTLLGIIIIGFSVISILPNGYTLDSTGGYSIIWFVCLYLIAAYLKLHEIPKLLKFRNYLPVYLVCTVLIGIGMVTIDNITNFIGINSFKGKLLQYNNIIVLIESVALFLWCSNLKIRSKTLVKMVAFLAPLTFAVYLIHEQPQLRAILYDKILHTEMCYHNPYSILIAVGSVITIFIICILIEFLRKKIVSQFLKYKKQINN